MNRINIRSFIVIISIVICINGCKEESSEKSIEWFLFEASNNPGLIYDVAAEINKNRITVQLPSDVNIKSLIATFSYTGDKVLVYNQVQTSGVSSQDFTHPVEYKVMAEDNSIQKYIVTVTISNNLFSSFEFRKSLNPSLPGNITALIRNDSVIAEFPVNISASNLIATFTTTLAMPVTVNGVTQISGISRNNFSLPVEYVVEGIAGSKKIYKTAIKTNIKADGSFIRFWIKKSLNDALTEDVEFDIDNNNLTIEGAFFRWINSEKPSLMKVSFEEPAVMDESGETVVQYGEMLVDFKQPVQINTTHSTPRTYTVSLICPQINASLPILRIETDEPILNKADYVKANLEIAGNGTSEGLWDFNREKIEIRLRGNSTLWLPKKPFRIKFPEKYSPLGLNHAKERSWVLLANDCDKSLIRNAVAFQISSIMQSGVNYRKFTPCTQFVDLYLNGMYEGNYHLTDQIEVNPGRVEVQSLKAIDAADPSTITGGYLLELDGFANSEPLWFSSPKGMKATIKHPDSDDYSPIQKAYITGYFSSVENFLFSYDFKNPSTGWRKYIDINSWVDYCIINEMAGNSDAWWSTFMSKERDVDYFVIGPVWDFDIAFNNDKRILNATTRLMADAAHEPKIWINRFMQDETFKAAIKARWNEKKDELFELTAYIDELTALLDMSQKANFKRWDITRQALGHANPAPANYQEAITQLKKYIEARYKFLDAEYNKW